MSKTKIINSSAEAITIMIQRYIMTETGVYETVN